MFSASVIDGVALVPYSAIVMYGTRRTVHYYDILVGCGQRGNPSCQWGSPVMSLFDARFDVALDYCRNRMLALTLRCLSNRLWLKKTRKKQARLEMKPLNDCRVDRVESSYWPAELPRPRSLREALPLLAKSKLQIFRREQRLPTCQGTQPDDFGFTGSWSGRCRVHLGKYGMRPVPSSYVRAFEKFSLRIYGGLNAFSSGNTVI